MTFATGVDVADALWTMRDVHGTGSAPLTEDPMVNNIITDSPGRPCGACGHEYWTRLRGRYRLTVAQDSTRDVGARAAAPYRPAGRVGVEVYQCEGCGSLRLFAHPQPGTRGIPAASS